MAARVSRAGGGVGPGSGAPGGRGLLRSVASAGELAVESFVAVDFETANRRGGASACQIALVAVEGGRVTERFSTLLAPPAGWDRFEFTWLHGIGPAEVADAPSWPEVARTCADFVAGRPVWAHWAMFDAGVWRDLDAHFGTDSLPRVFHCSCRTARSLVPGLVNYKLPTVLAACDPTFDLDHHRAESDAEACARIVIDLAARSRAEAAAVAEAHGGGVPLG